VLRLVDSDSFVGVLINNSLERSQEEELRYYRCLDQSLAGF